MGLVWGLLERGGRYMGQPSCQITNLTEMFHLILDRHHWSAVPKVYGLVTPGAKFLFNQGLGSVCVSLIVNALPVTSC